LTPDRGLEPGPQLTERGLDGLLGFLAETMVVVDDGTGQIPVDHH